LRASGSGTRGAVVGQRDVLEVGRQSSRAVGGLEFLRQLRRPSPSATTDA
jgi:hypothetical protein